MVPFCSRSGQQLGFGRKRRLGTLFQSRKRLEIAVEIHRRSRVVVERLAVGGGELRFEGVNPQRLSAVFRRVMVMAARIMFWPGTSAAVTKSIEPAPCGFGRSLKAKIPTTIATAAMQIRTIPRRRKIALGGSEFVADVKLGDRLGWRRRAGAAARIATWVDRT